MRYAGEVFRPGGKGGVAAGEGELSREDRKRARAGKKRAGKKRRSQKVGDKLYSASNSNIKTLPTAGKTYRLQPATLKSVAVYPASWGISPNTAAGGREARAQCCGGWCRSAPGP